MKRGRPTTYKPEYIDKVDEYLLECQDEELQVVKQSSEKYEMYDNKLKVKLPTIGGFAIFIGVPERTLYDWKDSYEDFSQSLERIVKEQQKRLINSGLSGEYNSTIAKLILSANHGMNEKSESESTVKVEDQSFTPEEKDSLLSLLNDQASA